MSSLSRTLARRREKRELRAFVRNTDPAVFLAYSRMNLLVGAASADATPEQQLRLEEIPDLVKRGIEPRVIGALVFDIMGDDWSPSPEWAERLGAVKEVPGGTS